MSCTARRCLVAICCNTGSVPQKTAQSLMEMGWGNRVETAKDDHGFEEISFAWLTTFPRVDALRDSAVCLAKKEGFSHLLFLDADMIWPTNVISLMLALMAAKDRLSVSVGVVGLVMIGTALFLIGASIATLSSSDPVGSLVVTAKFGYLTVVWFWLGCRFHPVRVPPALGSAVGRGVLARAFSRFT